jgi:hypothetical protein
MWLEVRGSNMSDSLSIYLQDHLAGSAYAIDLVEFMRDQHKNDDLGEFAAMLLAEIKTDRDVLQQIVVRVGGGGSSVVKELTAWLGEKVGRTKLRHEAGGGLGLFESLEFLALGITGKLKLWRALDVAAMSNPRLRGLDFHQLAARAENQHAMVERRRLDVARALFGAESAENSRRTRNSRTPSLPRKVQKRSMTPKVGGALLALAVVAAISLAPDVVRYMKIRSM